MNAQDESRTDADVYLLAGSNDRPLDNLRRGFDLLGRYCTVLALSSVYRTTARGETAGGPDYWNVAVRVRTELPPAAFKLRVLREIEGQVGRDRSSGGAVALDLDVVLWGDAVLTYGDKPWHAPAPDLLRFAHVAVPVAELAPDMPHPETGEPLRAIAARMQDDGITNLGRRFTPA